MPGLLPSSRLEEIARAASDISDLRVWLETYLPEEIIEGQRLIPNVIEILAKYKGLKK